MRTGRDGLVKKRDLGDRQVVATAANDLRSDNFSTALKDGWQVTKAGLSEFYETTIQGIVLAQEGSIIPASYITQVDFYKWLPDDDLNVGGHRIINVGDATSDTDALNRQTGDTRYSSPDTTIPNTLGAWSASDGGTYLDARGRERGVVNITWTDPTTNTDTSALTDLEEIMVSFKRAAATSFTHLAIPVGTQAATIDNLLVGVQYEFKGWCHDTHGHPSAFTASEFETPGGDATAPLQPTAPTVAGSGSRGINVIHALTKQAGGNLPDDLAHLIVYLDTDSTVDIDAAHWAGLIPASYTEITSGLGVHQDFNHYGTTNTIRGTTYYSAVIAVDQAGNKSPASPASAAVLAGAEAGSTAVPPTPTVSARLGGVVAAFNLADGTPDYGPANLDVRKFKLFGGWATEPTTPVDWLSITRGQLVNSMIVYKKISIPVGTVLPATYYVRARSLNSAGTLSDYGPEGSVSVVALGPNDIAAGAITADKIDVTILSAITASMGALTVDGTLTLAAGGMIKGTNLEIDSDGDMTATNVDVSGKITASSGSLSGLSISGTLTLSGSGNLITAASGARVELTAVSNDRLLFHSGGAMAGLEASHMRAYCDGVIPTVVLQGGVTTALPEAAQMILKPGATAGANRFLWHGCMHPQANATYDMGTADFSWLGLYAYDIYDEAGTLRWDLGGNITCAGTINGSAGSAAAPAIYLNGDTNTGLYQPAADQIGLATAGAAKLEILHTGANPVWIYCASALRRVIRSADQDGAGNYLLAVQDT